MDFRKIVVPLLCIASFLTGGLIWPHFLCKRCPTTTIEKQQQMQAPTPRTQSQDQLLMQAILDIPALDMINDAIYPAINALIKDELGLKSDYKFDFFVPKERQRLTLYYLNDIAPQGINLAHSFIEKWVSEYKNDLTIMSATLAPTVNFFGDHKDELVIMIDDQNGELAQLNQKIKEDMHQLNKEYQQANEADLYQISKSERFSYLPHIGLGRIRVTSIKKQIEVNIQSEDMKKIDPVFDQIAEHIVTQAAAIVKKILDSQKGIVSFTKISCLQLPSKKITDYPL